MIIDKILDRKDGKPYNPKKFYNEIFGYIGGCGDKFARNITYCMDYFSDNMVRKALCEYIIANNYNPKICDYINSKYWLVPDEITVTELNKYFGFPEDSEWDMDAINNVCEEYGITISPGA